MSTYREKLLSLSLGPKKGAKVTVDHTDNTINTVTEHWNDRRDVHVEVVKTISNKEKK